MNVNSLSYSQNILLYLKELKFQGKTNLREIEPHRLRELLYEDLKTYGKSSIGEIHQRIGSEIRKRVVRYELGKLIDAGRITKEGVKRAQSILLTKTAKKTPICQ